VVVVSDTSPIIVLHKAELLNILRQLFKIIYIPPAVFSELTQKASA
jgi:predicted nucleic acid-binding protein